MSPAASPASPPGIATPAPTIGDIVWTTAVDPVTNAPVDAVSAYSPDAARITATMQVSGIAPGMIFRASWAYNDTPLEAFTTEIDLNGQREPTWISFYIDRSPDVPWPEGTYAIAVSLDGAVVKESHVEVAAAS